MYLEKLKLSHRQINSLNQFGINDFTKSQMKIVKRINSGQNSAIRSQLEYDKQIAYLTGIIHNVGYKNGDVPRALILVPTTKMVEELLEIFSQLTEHTDIRFLGVASGLDQTDWIERIVDGIDVVIATPGKLFALFQSNLFKFNDLRHLIVDHLDYQFDLNYQGELQHIINELPTKCQSVYFSQHIFTKSKEWLEDNYDYMDSYRFDDELEKIDVEIVPQTFYMTPNNHTKVRLLKNIMENIKPTDKLIIVTRSTSAAILVSQYLERNAVGSFGFLHPKHKDNKNEYDTEQFEKNQLNVLITPLTMLADLNKENLNILLCFDMFLTLDDMVKYSLTDNRPEESVNIHFGTEEEKENWLELSDAINLNFKDTELPEGTLVDEKKQSIIEEENLVKTQIFSKGNSLKPKQKKFAGPKNTRKVTKFKKRK